MTPPSCFRFPLRSPFFWCQVQSVQPTLAVTFVTCGAAVRPCSPGHGSQNIQMLQKSIMMNAHLDLGVSGSGPPFVSNSYAQISLKYLTYLTTWFPTHRRPYGFRSFSSTKMSFSLQRNVIFSHVDVKNRVLKISKTTSFFDISSCFFGMQHFFSFFSEALHCFDGLAKFFEKPVRCQWSQRFSPTETFPIQGVLLC